MTPGLKARQKVHLAIVSSPSLNAGRKTLQQTRSLYSTRLAFLTVDGVWGSCESWSIIKMEIDGGVKQFTRLQKKRQSITGLGNKSVCSPVLRPSLKK